MVLAARSSHPPRTKKAALPRHCGRSLRRALPANVSSCYEKSRGQSLVTLPAIYLKSREHATSHRQFATTQEV
jgi:hypothetical protein